MGFLKRFFFLFFVCSLFVFLSQPYLFADPEQLTIEQELSKATQKSSTGLMLAIVGSVIFIGSMILTFADQKETAEVGIGEDWTVTAEYDKKVKGLYLVGDLLGLIVGGAGLAIHLPARKEIKRLEKEKDLTAQITLGMLPEHKAVGMKISLSW
ncbi:hypothetical protein ES703_36226 [subsurface metagenome]